MPRTVKTIPLLDLASYLLETPETPTHIGSLQIYQPVKGTRAQIVRRILDAYRASEVAEPFNYVPVFPAFGLPKWAIVDHIDPDYHVRHAALPRPGTQDQLISLVMDLHTGMLDRSRPGWVTYVIDGLEGDRFAIYWKVHHAYIDGASALLRADAITARSAEDLAVRAIWAPLFDEAGESGKQPGLNIASTLGAGAAAAAQLVGAMGRNLMQASGRLRRESPLPFTAPRSIFNAPVHATRRLGVGSVALDRLRAIAKQESVSLNDVALTLVGEALERYARERGEMPDKALVAACPMSIRKEGDTSASTQIAAISIKLGEPGAPVLERLRQVNASSCDAKEEARSMSREALVAYLMLTAGSADMLSKSPLGDYVPPVTNVNVSNVAGPGYRCFLGGAEMIASYPVSTLAGGTAINVTFGSCTGRMDYAVISDAIAIPEPQNIADYIELALQELENALRPVRKVPARARGARPRRAKKTPGNPVTTRRRKRAHSRPPG